MVLVPLSSVIMVAIIMVLSQLTAISEADDNSCTTYGDVRLVGGSGPYEGNVQVCVDGSWGYVCDGSWGSSDARVVCSQLGYSSLSTYSYPRRNSYFGHDTSGNMTLDNLYCSSYISYSKLTDCPHGSIQCGPFAGHIAGVTCSVGGSCTNGAVRLISQFSYGRSEGRVEVCYNQQWSTICKDKWSYTNTQVVCNQLGFNGDNTVLGSTSFGSTINPIVYNDVDCEGDETTIADCTKSKDITGCDHSKDVSVRCYSLSNTTSTCNHGDIRLWSAFESTPSNEGMLQICSNGQWTAMCDRYSYSSCYIGRIACQSMGFEGAYFVRTNAGIYYGHSYYNDDTRYYCYSYHSSLSQCSKYNNYYGCGSYTDALGIICANTTEADIYQECSNGDIRLVNGERDNEGRVEYCYNGQWSPMCSLSVATARLVCQSLGYEYQYAIVDYGGTYGRSDTRSSFNYLSCSLYSTSLSQCSVIRKGNACFLSESGSTCYREYGLTCYEPIEICQAGDLRLVGGQIEQEGTVEVCYDGTWGTICSYGWNSIDAYTVCKTLGYDGPNPISYYNSRFGQGTGFPVWSYLHCYGWENSIYECGKSIYPNIYQCSSYYEAIGVTCKENCQNGEVRLSGGEHSNEGTVEVCYNNLWGQISDEGWTNANARVVCRYLGYTITNDVVALQTSYYGMSNITIHLQNVNCIGNEYSITECSKTINSFYQGKALISKVNVAGVDCVYDEPTPPPCITNPSITPSDSCTNSGSVRLIHNGTESTSEGRVEYCTGQYWTPLCTMDNRAAAVTCRQLGHTQYQWGTIIESDSGYGILLNYSLVQNVTCTGLETSLSHCTVYDPQGDCLPWCPNSNIGLKCFTPSKAEPICIEWSIRLVDGIISQEGRVEVCVNGVWGSVCDDGWDQTDAHVVCRQLGHPKLEPYVYTNSRFGSGQYPIVYSNVNCGGWEDTVYDCSKDDFIDTTCSRTHTAGVLCGYNCSDGDVRLVDGPTHNEGTVEVCYSHIWGLIDDNGWSLSDARVVCSQLGYGTEGDIIVHAGSHYGKSSNPLHLSNLQCQGNERSIADCSQTTYSLEEGREKVATVNVAGLKCSVPNGCEAPPTGGTQCIDGHARLIGGLEGEGRAEYCHRGYWTPLCSLNETEATVLCRSQGYLMTEFVSIFTDGRFNDADGSHYTSYIENITCPTDRSSDFTQCLIVDGCQTQCSNPIGVKCFEPVIEKCEEGDLRLVNGGTLDEGRLEVCHKDHWGTVCGDGFQFVDAFVACNSFGSMAEPVVYNGSWFGDGDLPIMFSQLQCNGEESNLQECDKLVYGNFTCSRQNVAGVKCKDDCEDGSIRLIGGQHQNEGTVQVCYKNVWGLIIATDWSKDNAAVVCNQLGYSRTGAVSVTDSRYGKSDHGIVIVGEVTCIGSEDLFDDCDIQLIPIEEGRQLVKYVNVSGVVCGSSVPEPSPNIAGQTSRSTGMSVAVGIMGFMLVLVVAVLISVVLIARMKLKRKQISVSVNSHHNMTSINPMIDEEESASLDDKIIPL